ncbi:ABC transporter permease [Niallia oryzisoli]|uniref:ABC transporter permease n=1 Tax=Niallia oryzisoli TaxID=1737571 RepID=A0ABZ2C869_9BACI
MKNIFILTELYLKIFMKNRKSAVFLWLTPIFFLLGAALIGQQLLKEESFVQPFQVAIVNEDQTIETEFVVRELTESPHLNKLITTVEVDRNKAESYLRDNQIAAIIQIPKGFSRDVAKGKNTPVIVIGNGKRPLQSRLITYVMESAANYTSAAQSGINTIDHFMSEADFSKEDQKDQFKRNVLSFGLHVLGRGEIFAEIEQHYLFQENIWQYYAVSIFILLIMIWCFMSLFLIKNNLNRSIHFRLKGLGFTKLQLVFSRMMAGYLLVVCSSLVILLSILFWKGFKEWSLIAELTGATMLIAFVFLSLFVLIETMLVSEKIYPIFGILLIAAGAVIGGHFIPAVYFSERLLNLNEFSLNGWVLKWTFSLLEEYSIHSSAMLGLYLFLFSLGCSMISGLILYLREGKGVNHENLV